MNIYLDTVGCRLNQSEIETFARQFRCAGHTIVASAAQADLVVINTCTVTAQAAADSRQKARQAARQQAAQIVLTGCWATMEPGAAGALPQVSRVIGNLQKDHLVADLLQLRPEALELAGLHRQPLPGIHQRTRAFIKAQDGCNNCCAYCVTCLARGPSRSRPIEAVLQDVRAALEGGTREIVLTGVHLGAWGRDLQPASRLSGLIRALLDQPDLPRLRLSSLEPWDLEADFFALWKDPRLCPALHLPLQSGSALTLQRMNRQTTPGSFAALLDAARAAIPDLAITTDVMVGFPGESEAEFEASLAFVREMQFAGGHVFTYSARPGTAAARMPDAVAHPLRKQRSRLMREMLAQAASTFQARFIDYRLPVLWESATPISSGSWQLSGLTNNNLRVTAQSSANLWNQISLVRLTAQSNGAMQGIICDRNQEQP